MKSKKVSARIFLYPLIILATLLAARSCATPSDADLISKVVKLRSPHGSCTGEQIKAPSGATYILTAGHCRVLEVEGSIEAVREDGTALPRRIIAEDQVSDLLLLEGLPNTPGLEIADRAVARQHVRTFTHGAGFPTYKTEGVLVGYDRVQALLSLIGSDEEAAKCGMPKQHIVTDETGVFRACIIDVQETVTTAFIVPGSSGGPVVDDNGALTGVVSAGGNGFGFLVSLSDIQRFLRAY